MQKSVLLLALVDKIKSILQCAQSALLRLQVLLVVSVCFSVPLENISFV